MFAIRAEDKAGDRPAIGGHQVAIAIEKGQLDTYRKDLKDEYRIYQEAAIARLRGSITGKKVNGGAGLAKGTVLTEEVLNSLELSQWFELRMADAALAELIENAQGFLDEKQVDLDRRFEIKKGKITGGDDLAHGVLKLVKVNCTASPTI